MSRDIFTPDVPSEYEVTSRNDRQIIFEKLKNKFLTDKLKQQILKLILSRSIYEINVINIFRQLNCDIVLKYFKHLPINIKNNSEESKPFNSALRDYLNDSIMDVCLLQGVPIILKIDMGNIVRTNTVVSLCVPNTRKCIQVLKRFVNILDNENKKAQNKVSKAMFKVLQGSDYFVDHFTRPKRTFNDVFITKTETNEIIESIRLFKNNKKWYNDHNIAYHYGLMLYGPPGSGKTSLIYAISNHFNLVPYFIPSNKIECIIKDSSELTIDKNLKLVIVEDVDTCPLVNREFTDVEMDMRGEFRYRATTSDFLNLMDGALAVENVIWVFTTNHVDKIDPAIIRAGRIDKKIEIGYVCDETFDKFLMYHFKKHLPKDTHTKQNMTFAEIQVSVMEGKTFNDMLKLYTDFT